MVGVPDLHEQHPALLPTKPMPFSPNCTRSLPRRGTAHRRAPSGPIRPRCARYREIGTAAFDELIAPGVAATLRQHSAQIGHIQIADNPGRHQPGTGEICFPFVFREIDAVKYEGCLGLEYIPTPDTAASLGWITEMNCEL